MPRPRVGKKVNKISNLLNQDIADTLPEGEFDVLNAFLYHQCRYSAGGKDAVPQNSQFIQKQKTIQRLRKKLATLKK